MGQIHYNAWQLEFKQPFGALQPVIMFSSALGLTAKMLRRSRLALPSWMRTRVFYPLTQDEDESDKYTGEIKITTSGLYHYYFRVRRENDAALYLGHLHGGLGKETTDISKVEPFQLTCLRSAGPRPEWLSQCGFLPDFSGSVCKRQSA